MRAHVLLGSLSVLIVTLIIFLTLWRLPYFRDNSDENGNALGSWIKDQYLEVDAEDKDYTAYPTRNCTLCKTQGLQCCFSDGRESCLGSEYHCAQRAKQSCPTGHCPKLGQNKSAHSAPYNRLCFTTDQHYYYCKGQSCGPERKCADGTYTRRAFIRPNEVVPTMLRDTLAVFAFGGCVGLLAYLYRYHERQPLKARNVWLLAGDTICSLLWITVILFHNSCPCVLHVAAIIFSTLYLSMGKVCRMLHIIFSNNIETKKKQIQDLIYSELAKSVKQHKTTENYIINYHDEDAVEETLEKIYNTRWYLTYPMLVVPLVISAFFTMLYVFTSALILGYDLVTSAESCVEHKSVGTIVMASLTISIIVYLGLVCYARQYCANTVVAYTREFALDTATFICLSLLVSFCYIFGMITSGPSKQAVLSVNMISPFISLINVTLMLGNSVGLPVLESYVTSKYDQPASDGFTSTDTTGKLRRNVDADKRNQLSRLSQVLKGTLSQDLLKTYASYEYGGEFVMLWRLIDTYRNHQNALRPFQRKQLLKYMYYVFKGSTYALPVKIPTLMGSPELDMGTLYDIQMEVIELHLLPMYMRMSKLRRFEEQLFTLSEIGALPAIEAYDICSVEEPTKPKEEETSYSSGEDEEDIVSALPGRHVNLPHAVSSEEPRR